MTIEISWSILIGVAIIAYYLCRNWLKVTATYRVERKGKNWVVRDSKGRFVRISSNIFDILSLGV